MCRGDRRRRARPPVRDRPLADPGRGDVPALRLVPGLQPDRRAVDDVPHPGRRARTASARRCSSSGRRASPRSSSSNFSFGPRDVMIVFSASGLSAVPVEMARGARRRGLRVIAVTSVEQSMSSEPDPAVGTRLLDEADLVIDLCTPHADALVEIEGLDTPVGPGLDHHGRGDRQFHQGADRPAPRGAGRHAACHHPRVGRRRRALAGAVRTSLWRARTAHRSCHHPRYG